MTISNELLLLLQSLVLVVAYFAKRALKRMESNQDEMQINQADILAEVRKTNGRVGRLEQRAQDHDKQDDERHSESLRKFDSIFNTLNRRDHDWGIKR